MGRKRTQPDDEKYLKRRRYYLKSKGYSDEEIEAMLEQTAEDPLFNDVLNDIDLVNQFNKTLIDLSNKEPEQDNEIINEKNTNTNTNTNTFTNEFVNEDTKNNVNDNVNFEFDDTLRSEDKEFTEQQQGQQQQANNLLDDTSSVSGKMFMLTVNVLLTSASKFVKKDISLTDDEVKEFAKLYDEAYPEGLPVNPKIVFWGGLAFTITTKALK